MNIFALDSSGKTASVAIMQDGLLTYESYLSTGNTHSEALMPMLQNAFTATNLQPQDINLYGVNTGPGSFTGLRIGAAIIKGMALVHDTQCAGVSTLESLAYSFAGEGVVITALNARRGEVYYSAFECCKEDVKRLMPDSVAAATVLESFISERKESVWLMGDGAHIVLNAINLPNIKMYNANYLCGRAHAVALCAKKMFDAGQSENADKLSVEYHRLSQAQRERQEREERNA